MLRLYLTIGLIVAAVAGLGATHYWAYRNGRDVERADALARSIELIKERSETNEEIGRMDDAALCRELGGVWVQPDDICQ